MYNRNLLGSGKISKANKKKRAANFGAKLKENKNIQLTGILLEWVEQGVLQAQLEKQNCEYLKEVCSENQIPRAGAKYEVVGKIRKTVMAWKDQQEKAQKKKKNVEAASDLQENKAKEPSSSQTKNE
jgi:hypothetical protein